MRNADPLDNAADLAAIESESSVRIQLSKHNFDKPSRNACEECEIDIPAQRQKLGGVTLCVDCESDRVKRNKFKGFL